MTFHLLLDLEVLVGQSLANLLRLQSEYRFEGILLGSEHLNLTLMEIELLSKLANHIL